MTFFLFLEALFQLLHDLFPAAQGLDLRLFLVRQVQLRQLAQPFLRNFRRGALLGRLQTLEDLAEHPVELVQVALVLHQAATGEVVKIVHVIAGHAGFHGLQKHQVFLQAAGNLGRFQFEEKIEEHVRSTLVV